MVQQSFLSKWAAASSYYTTLKHMEIRKCYSKVKVSLEEKIRSAIRADTCSHQLDGNQGVTKDGINPTI